MGVRENKVERLLDTEFKKIGGLTRKWVSPGRDGVPDRICIVEGRVYFVEVKTIDGKLSKVQEREIKRLEEVGVHAHVVYGAVDVHILIETVVKPELKSLV
jgi:Holliday junction resolvase